MKSYLNIEEWSRRNHFNFFKGFSEPFFGVTVQVDCTATYLEAQEAGGGFFFRYLHKSLKAVNEIDNFTYRIEGDKVAVYDRVDPAPTVARPDHTFGYCTFPYSEDFEKFSETGQRVFEEVRQSDTLDPTSTPNVVHYSVLPWLHFTSNSHARHSPVSDSIPKITFGKLDKSVGQYIIPMSVHAHHALVDGYHVGKYVEYFQELLHTR